MEAAEEPVRLALEESSTTGNQGIDSGNASGRRELTHFTRRPRPSDLPLRLHTWPPPWYRERGNDCGDDKGKTKKTVGRHWGVERMEKVQCADAREDGWGKARRCEVVRVQRDDIAKFLRRMEVDEGPRQETVEREPRLPRDAAPASLQDGIMRLSRSKRSTIRADPGRTKQPALLGDFEDTAGDPHCDFYQVTAGPLPGLSSRYIKRSSECAPRDVPGPIEIAKSNGKTRGSQLAVETIFSGSKREGKVKQERGSAFPRTTCSSSTLTLEHQSSVDGVQLHFWNEVEVKDSLEPAPAAEDGATTPSASNTASSSEHSPPLKAPVRPMACRPAEKLYSHPVCVPLSRSSEKLRRGLASSLAVAVSLGHPATQSNLDPEDDPDIPWTWRRQRGEEARALDAISHHPCRHSVGQKGLEIRIPPTFS